MDEMVKTVVSSKKTPVVNGAPYSPAIKSGSYLFISGQIADDTNADIKTQTRQTIEKIKLITESAGVSLNNVVKTTIYLTDLDDYDSMNEVYRKFFKKDLPARACIQVSRLVLGCNVEIEAIAFLS